MVFSMLHLVPCDNFMIITNEKQKVLIISYYLWNKCTQKKMKMINIHCLCFQIRCHVVYNSYSLLSLYENLSWTRILHTLVAPQPTIPNKRQQHLCQITTIKTHSIAHQQMLRTLSGEMVQAVKVHLTAALCIFRTKHRLVNTCRH